NEEEEPEEGEELHGDRQGPGSEAPPEEVPRIEHRLAPTQLPGEEDSDSDETADECCQRQGIAPAPVRAFDRAEHDCRQPDDREQRADRVKPWWARLARRGNDQQRPCERDSSEHHVEREERRPGEEVEQDARGEEADDGAARCDSDPGPHRYATLFGRKDRREPRATDGTAQRT